MAAYRQDGGMPGTGRLGSMHGTALAIRLPRACFAMSGEVGQPLMVDV